MILRISTDISRICSFLSSRRLDSPFEHLLRLLHCFVCIIIESTTAFSLVRDWIISWWLNTPEFGFELIIKKTFMIELFN